MKNIKITSIKKSLLSLSLAGVMLVTTGCIKRDEKGIPLRYPIGSEYNEVENYYTYGVRNNEATKLYKAENVYILFNKENYEVEEYIYHVNWLGGVELYDLESEEMLVYSSGIATVYNEDYYNYIRENNYQVSLREVSNSVEGVEIKEYYSLDEIKELEPEILNALKIINELKNK